MKKLSMLIALIICVTVGGVYAAWTYTGSTLSSVDRTLSHGLTTATTDGDVGILTIASNTVDIAIDQKEAGDYTAVMNVTGEVKVQFTPNNGAPDNVKENGVPIKVSVYINNPANSKYNDKDVYMANNYYYDINNWTENGDIFEAIIPNTEIVKMFKLNDGFVLDTHAKYLDFHDVEEDYIITLKVEAQ